MLKLYLVLWKTYIHSTEEIEKAQGEGTNESDASIGQKVVCMYKCVSTHNIHLWMCIYKCVDPYVCVHICSHIHMHDSYEEILKRI